MTEAAANVSLKELISMAHGYFQRKDYSAARNAYASLRSLSPKDAFFADRYTDTLLKLSEWENVRDAASFAIELHGATVGRVTQFARALIELHHYDEAMAALSINKVRVEPNANFFVFSVVAAVGSCRIDKALIYAKQVERLASTEGVAAINYLYGLLERLGKLGHAANVLLFIDAILTSFPDTMRLLRIGIALSSSLRDWERKLNYAEEMVRLAPNLCEGYAQRIDALIFAEREEIYTDLFNEMTLRFPQSERTFDEGRFIEELAMRLTSVATWRRVITSNADPAQSFHTQATRAVAYMTLRQYEQAAEVVRSAMRVHNEHPWFQLLLGICNEEQGCFETALHWMSQAAESGTDSANVLLHLCRVQCKVGYAEEARRTATELLQKYPNMPVTKALAEKFGGHFDVSVVTPPVHKPPSSGPQSWLHGGDSGDLIYALSAMQAGGGGHLYLTCMWGTREPMNDEKISFLTPLIAAQPYAHSVRPWQGEYITRNFITARHRMVPDIDLATQQWWAVLDKPEPDVAKPWLSVPEPHRHGRPVFARSPRYRNTNWDLFWNELKAVSPDAIFVGTSAEFKEFGSGEHYFARDALDLARVIQGASIFVGNQSFPYALAEGLKVGRLLEASHFTRNCIFPGALALDFAMLQRQ